MQPRLEGNWIVTIHKPAILLLTEKLGRFVEKQAVMISFRVDDIEIAVAELVAKGVKFYPSKEKAIFDVGPSLVATFVDPDGNWMQLSQPKSAL